MLTFISIILYLHALLNFGIHRLDMVSPIYDFQQKDSGGKIKNAVLLVFGGIRRIFRTIRFHPKSPSAPKK